MAFVKVNVQGHTIRADVMCKTPIAAQLRPCIGVKKQVKVCPCGSFVSPPLLPQLLRSTHKVVNTNPVDMCPTRPVLLPPLPECVRLHFLDALCQTKGKRVADTQELKCKPRHRHQGTVQTAQRLVTGAHLPPAVVHLLLHFTQCVLQSVGA
jgi:hypothetical protein